MWSAVAVIQLSNVSNNIIYNTVPFYTPDPVPVNVTSGTDVEYNVYTEHIHTSNNSIAIEQTIRKTIYSTVYCVCSY